MVPVVVGVRAVHHAHHGQILAVGAGDGVQHAQPAQGEGDGTGAHAPRACVPVGDVPGVELVAGLQQLTTWRPGSTTRWSKPAGIHLHLIPVPRLHGSHVACATAVGMRRPSSSGTRRSWLSPRTTRPSSRPRRPSRIPSSTGARASLGLPRREVGQRHLRPRRQWWPSNREVSELTRGLASRKTQGGLLEAQVGYMKREKSNTPRRESYVRAECWSDGSQAGDRHPVPLPFAAPAAGRPVRVRR